jgi:hypothetical protein
MKQIVKKMGKYAIDWQNIEPQFLVFLVLFYILECRTVFFLFSPRGLIHQSSTFTCEWLIWGITYNMETLES